MEKGVQLKDVMLCFRNVRSPSVQCQRKVYIQFCFFWHVEMADRDRLGQTKEGKLVLSSIVLNPYQYKNLMVGAVKAAAFLTVWR